MFKITAKEKKLILRRRKIKAETLDDYKKQLKKGVEKMESDADSLLETLEDMSISIEENDLECSPRCAKSVEFALDSLQRVMDITEKLYTGKLK